MLRFLRSRSDVAVLVLVLAAVAVIFIADPIVGGPGSSTAHRFVPTTVELPADSAEAPAPTF